jgi:hypothetical protein
MKKFLQALLGLVILVACLGAAECDPAGHKVLEANQQAVELCKARGGVPIVKADADYDSHSFIVLDKCEFPCNQNLAVEK